ncbi:MAG: exodeoxyribonuclease VII small subunit [Oscillospiraceae bacterium]
MKEQTYEQAITKLEKILEKLENNSATLDESVKLFEEGTELAAFCNKCLDNAEVKITNLLESK